MNTLNLTVTGMSCMGCVNSVKNLLSTLPAVSNIQVDLASGRVSLEHDPARTDAEAIRQAIRAGGYGVAD
jgi:copper chaperone